MVLVLCTQYGFQNATSVVNDYDEEFFQDYSNEQLEKIEVLLERAINENKALYNYPDALATFYPDEKVRNEMIDYFNGGNDEIKRFGVASF